MNILVLCTGNSARSILLECILNKRGGARVKAYSAGSRPAGQVHPMALRLLTRLGYTTSQLRSKSWDEFATPDAPEMGLVITVCGNAAEEACPIWPGAPVRTHWGVDDPATASEEDQQDAFEAAYAILEARARSMLDLPFETMDQSQLSAELAKISRVVK
ncbi:MAG: arsenate reductase ArsC [Pseudomonadota bacterium]